MSRATFPKAPAGAERAAELGDAARFVCHGSSGSASPSPAAKAAHVEAVARRARRACPPRRRAGPAARRSRRAAPRGCTADEPARRLEAERRRHRLLQQRPRRHRRRRARSASRASAGDAVELLEHERRASAERRASPRVSTTSWLVAPRWTKAPPRRRPARAAPARAGRPGSRPPRLGESRRRRTARAAQRLRDRRGGVGGIDAGQRLGGREGALDLEHRREPGASETASRSSSGTKSAAKAQSAKNAVCRRPGDGRRSGGRRRRERRRASRVGIRRAPAQHRIAAFASASPGK